jgi:hypothetical protein
LLDPHEFENRPKFSDNTDIRTSLIFPTRCRISHTDEFLPL